MLLQHAFISTQMTLYSYESECKITQRDLTVAEPNRLVRFSERFSGSGQRVPGHGRSAQPSEDVRATFRYISKLSTTGDLSGNKRQ